MKSRVPSGWVVHETAVLAAPMRPLQGLVESSENPRESAVNLQGGGHIGPGVVVGEGVTLGDRVIVDSQCIIERSAKIGSRTLLVYRAIVGGGAIIGMDCVIGGVVSENATVGDRCRIFGTIVHKQSDPSPSWDHRESPEPSVVVRDDCFIGFGAFVAGGITIGPRSYVCAGAIVTRDVPPEHIAHGTNKITHFTDWKGELSESPHFRFRG